MEDHADTQRRQDPEFDGTDRVLLPSGFLDTSDAAYELHRDCIDARVHDLDIGGLSRRLTDAFIATLRRAAALWLALGFLTVCI